MQVQINTRLRIFFRSLWYWIDRGLVSVALFFLWLYQKTLSPDKSFLFGWLRGRICAHEPHCSQYSIECFRRYGFLSGCAKTMDRVTRCNPAQMINYDPPQYRVVFCSSAPIGIPFLEALRHDPMMDVVGVVTMPDQPTGRGMQVKANVVKERAQEEIGRNGTPKSRDTASLEKQEEKGSSCHVERKPMSCLFSSAAVETSIKFEDRERQSGIIDPSTPTMGGQASSGGQAQQTIYDRGQTEPPFIVTPTTLRQSTDEGQQFLAWLQQKQPDYLVVIAYGHIIPQVILDVAKILPVNVHGSLLPALRGASPIQSVYFQGKMKNEKGKVNEESLSSSGAKAKDLMTNKQNRQFCPDASGAPNLNIETLKHGNLQTGITLIKMVKAMDAGPMLGKLPFAVPFYWTSVDIIEHMKKVGPAFLLQTMKDYPKGYLALEEQDPSQVTFCGKYTKEDGQINPGQESLETIYAKYRAFAMWPKTRFVMKNEEGRKNDAGGMMNEKGGTKNEGEKRIIIERLVLDEGLFETWKDKPLFISSETNPAILELLVKPEGKKVMTWKEFLNGNK